MDGESSTAQDELCEQQEEEEEEVIQRLGGPSDSEAQKENQDRLGEEKLESPSEYLLMTMSS